MKIIIEREDGFKVSCEDNDDIDIYDIIENICGLLVSFGYQYQSVKDGILAKAEEYEEDK